jgi:hypothetical protein
MKRHLINDYIARLWLCNLLFLSLGIGLLYISTFVPSEVAKDIISNVASIFIVAGVYNPNYSWSHSKDYSPSPSR